MAVTAYRFADHRLEPASRRLLAGGQPLKLGGRAFDLLLTLLERHEHVVSKDELLDRVWPRRVVEENNLQVQVATLRKLLGMDAIATVPGRGYRFAWPVTVEGPADAPPAPAALPAATAGPALMGREADLAALRALVAEGPLVTLAGSGGIGKTCLARAALAAWPEGGVWVELAPVAPAGVAAATARALGASAEERHVDAIAAALTEAPRLVVLDNAEHLLAEVAALLSALLPRAPHTRWLVTSQEVLRLPQEQVMRLEPLALPAAPGLDAALASGAVALFAARARAADRRFRLDAANVDTVTELCRRLDGIPLALELAAARVPLLGVRGVLARLDDRFRLLAQGARDAPARQQTLHAALSWSHALLEDDAQRVFRRLGVFVGSFTMEAAQQVAADEALDGWAVLEALGSLVDKSLVLADEGDPPRYRLLETTRQFALQRLQDAGEAADRQRLHAQAVAAVVERVRASARVANAGLLARLAAEVGNARAALHWAVDHADIALGLRLATAASFPFMATNQSAEFLTLAAPWVGHAERDGAEPGAAAALLRRVAAVGKNGSHALALRAALRAVPLLRAGAGSALELHEALVAAVALGARRGEDLPYTDLLAEARALQQPDWPLPTLVNWQWARERWLARAGRHEEALAAALATAEAGREHAAIGAPQIAQLNAARHELALGRVADAEARARAATAALDPKTAQPSALGYGWSVLAACEARRGDVTAALASCQRARPLLEIEGDDGLLLPVLAACAAGQGRVDAAARIAGHADAAQARTGCLPEPTDIAQPARLRAVLRATLAPAALAEALAAGAQMTRAEVFALAFAAT